MSYGARRWMIPDGFWNSRSNGRFPSHESVCVLNAARTPARIDLVLFFEDRDKQDGFHVDVPAERCLHIRLDRLLDDRGRPVPTDIPYAIVLESDIPVVVQYSRMDTSQSEMGLMTTLGFPVD